MKQNLLARLALCLLITLCLSISVFAFQGSQPFSADSSTTSANGNLNMTGKVYFPLPKMRMDVTNSGKSASPGPIGCNMIMMVPPR